MKKMVESEDWSIVKAEFVFERKILIKFENDRFHPFLNRKGGLNFPRILFSECHPDLLWLKI
ncbi:hypothetical protein [Leptospira yasudae]|uniref:Uncharacterized protein n=1 Tax=Leptospira yasudae TaxID=2202201 RepID=A0A6N4QYH7_9LEPT|nr:hypothetical protein [Leptospira yasudae]TGL77479.1 hypothetical protein EHQ72_11750 [Leptospira yasudae]TGL82650.1 hypothetical protein EHQ77_03050 [Leptospira yasudae]TGL87986.1 hypothetical protein EHQ83_04330 [Leptospira yasudae]